MPSMENTMKRLLPITALAILLLSSAPAAFASTLTINLNPSTQVAEVTSVSTTDIVLTYPVGSHTSSDLNGVNSTVSLSGSFSHGSNGTDELQSSFNEEDQHVAVQNMSVSINYSAKGNATTLVVHKETDITAWVTGVFKVTNGTVTADLRWRSFAVLGAMNLDLEDHSVDVNQVGSTMQYSLSDHPLAAEFLFSEFGGFNIWHRPTLNFSALNTPLSTWTRNYNSATNTTTFSKTISGESTMKATMDYNGQNYTLSAISDPSAAVNVVGYAVASGDSLMIQPTPTLLSPLIWAAVAAVVAIAGAVTYMAIRSRARARVSMTLASTG
jgi:hypothetical protein